MWVLEHMNLLNMLHIWYKLWMNDLKALLEYSYFFLFLTWTSCVGTRMPSFLLASIFINVFESSKRSMWAKIWLFHGFVFIFWSCMSNTLLLIKWSDLFWFLIICFPCRIPAVGFPAMVGGHHVSVRSASNALTKPRTRSNGRREKEGFRKCGSKRSRKWNFWVCCGATFCKKQEMQSFMDENETVSPCSLNFLVWAMLQL